MLAAFITVALLPLAVVAIGVRNEMRVRVLAQSDRRAESLAEVITDDLAETHAGVGAAVARIAGALPDDSRFRAGALRPEAADRAYVLDHAARAMQAAGLSLLQIRNDSGRILSSGHFPAEFDRVDPLLPETLAAASGTVLLAARTAEGSILGVARVDSVMIAGRSFSVIGARAVDQAFVDRLARGDEMRVAVALPHDTISSRGTAPARGSADGDRASESIVRRISIPYVDARSDSVVAGAADVAIARSLAGEEDLRKSVDRWIIGAFLLATAGAILAALWLAARLSRPMEELAHAAATVDLDRLDVGFATGRDDEVGVLSRRLSSMVERLKGSAARLRAAERRAAVGDVARQVNHDIKNGLAPIRNVVRHLSQVARDEPDDLPGIFAARQGTLDSSIAYLETLAENYARLSPALVTRPCHVDAVIAEVVGSAAGRGATIRARAEPGLAPVLADAVVLRRILENLVGNAIDSLEGRAGEVTVSAAPVLEPPGHRMVRITVEDTGRGMNENELAHAFDDFYTTKAHGTGLGLSVVRRLIADLSGSLRIETEPGVGTRISVDLPASPAAPLAVGTSRATSR
jgi:signal transduction histidine kinase